MGKTCLNSEFPRSSPEVLNSPEEIQVDKRLLCNLAGLRGENPGAFPKFCQQPLSLPERAQTLPGKTFRAAGTPERSSPALAGKPFKQGILDRHSLLEFSECSLSGIRGAIEPLDEGVAKQHCDV